MKFLSLKKILHYLYDKLTGTFAGFVIGMTASGLVSRFFETRSFKNLWGLTARKRVVDKETFSQLEWIISILIGFIVFEVITKVIRKKMDARLPRYKLVLMRWAVRNDIHKKFKHTYGRLHLKKTAFFSTMYAGTRKAIGNYSKK